MASHCFQEKTFGKLTYCDRCNGLLWGLAKQGVKCADCGYVCHQGCTDSALPCSQQSNIQTTAFSSRAQQHLQRLRHLHPTTTKSTTSTETPIQPPLDLVKELITPEYIEKSLVSAAIQSFDTSLPVNDYLATLPPLNPQATAKNFSRFVSRCGPIFGFRDKVILLLSWDKPIDTFVALVAYCIVCFYPKLLLFIPQLILLQILVNGYYKRYGRNQRRRSITESGYNKDSSGTSGGSSLRSAFAFNLATALFPVFDETSPEYGRNLQNMQNMMGETSDLYDLVQSHAHYFDWSDEQMSLHILQGVLVSMVVVSLAVYFIPFHLICLIGGVGMFMINTRFCKYLLKEWVPTLTLLIEGLMPWMEKQNRKLEHFIQDQDRVREISLYENQCLSNQDKKTWTDIMPNGIGPWSDYSGKHKLPSNKQKSIAPDHYEWIQDEWKLDTIGCWNEETLCLELLMKPDKDGWVYFDHLWCNPSDKFIQGITTTRRRRWKRECQRIV
ncbi:integral peroxisomal membrane peroxin-domain-containing protein [Halteromyces radiatus]|uniref:integral peroxisomal membrane peroxin-domain-containing protein n=1 Tax=Halteromyces radiatus TaxID=101107 RepID=UPI002220103A|nr:integral peroxisomal membrane peroxin-domain-containing protein [Halteromyces radiatus]KAI8098925.1 integral peroxisomal membrane peroxin-domain-containing protein [Halteromyces radiatus]